MKHLLYRRLGILFVAIISTVAVPLARSQAYPSKPVRWILPFPSGIGTDVFARMIGPKVSTATGQPVLIENRPGANGVIGVEAVKNAAADGYTILFTAAGEMTLSLFTKKNLPYDPVNDFAPITAALEPLEFIVMRPALPGNNLRELLDHARKNPGKLSYGSSGVGSYFQLLGESINNLAGTNILHVPYKGTNLAAADVMAGTLDVTFGTLGGVRQLITSGKLKVIATTAPVRYAGMPDTPTIAEVLPGFEKPSSFFSFWAPAGTPQPIIRRLNEEIIKAMSTQDMREWFDSTGFLYIASSPEQLAAMQKKGIEVSGRLAKLIGLQPE